MAIQLQGNSGTLWDVDGTTFRAGKFTLRPMDYGAGGIYAVSASSGTIGAGLAGQNEIFQWRYVTATGRVAVVLYVAIGASALLAATVASLNNFKLTAARNWTVAGSGGTRLTLTGNNAKLRTSMATSEVNDAGICTTAALTTGTKTLDTQELGSISFGVGTGALTTQMDTVLVPKTPLFDAYENGGHPYVCANQEGFVIRMGVNAMGATMTWGYSVDVVWAEVPTF